VHYDLLMSYTNLLYHIVYGTKDRLPLITKELRPHMHHFLGALISELHGTPLEINGVADHVHVLARIKPVTSVSEFLSKLKSQSQAGLTVKHTAGSNGR
jgi:REP-associated tyrosine transposase